MDGRKVAVSLFFLSLFLFYPFFCFYFPYQKNWVEVDRFTGSSWYGGTRSFRIDYDEWRIRWQYEPIIDDQLSSLSNFYFQVKEIGNKTFDIVLGNNRPTGEIHLFKNGTFYLLIRGGLNANNYTIIIEQNIA